MSLQTSTAPSRVWLRVTPLVLPRASLLSPLLAILALQSLASLSLRNTAFQDEALYLYAGRQLFDAFRGGPQVSEPYALYFSGLPNLYPVLAGALDSVWGLEGARLLSLGCMLSATVAVHRLGRQLYDSNAALIAAALFAVQGSVLFLGHFATYDAMCLALLAWASALAARAGRARWAVWAASIGALLLAAVATKYAGLLFVPTVLAVLVWIAYQTYGWRQAVLRLGVAVAVLVLPVVLLMLTTHSQVLEGLRTTTTERVALLQAPRSELVSRAVTEGGPLTLLALAGLLLRGPSRPLALALAGSAFLAPLYHIYKAESISMHKHIAFGLFFAAPVAGYAVARLCSYGPGRVTSHRWLAALATIVLFFGVGLRLAQNLFAEWANSEDVVHVLRTQVRPGSGHILAEESEVPRYYLQDVVAGWQWSHLYWFEYTDASGQLLHGEAAYKAALAEGYFDLVVLRYGPNADLASRIDGELRDGKNYDLLGRIPVYTTFGAGDYWIWRKHVPPAAGAVP